MSKDLLCRRRALSTLANVSFMNIDEKYRIRGFYETTEANQEILLCKERLKVETGSNTFEADSLVVIRHQPRLRLEVEISGFTNIEALQLWDQGKVTITFCKRNVSTDAYVTKIETKDGALRLVTLPHPLPIVSGSSRPLSAVLFHVVSFYNFIAPRDLIITDDKRSYRSGRAIIEVDEWRVIVDAVDGIKDISDSLSRNGGYAITHHGKLVTRDGSTFSPDPAEDFLGALHYFLSFCRGSWVDVMLPVGIDTDGEVCWEQWGERQIDPWERRLSWFDEYHGGLLGEVFPGFWRLWKNPRWRDPIKTAIYWYVRSNNTRGVGTDGAIVLAQAALEQLSWMFLVEERKALSPEGFEKLSAADTLRLLLSTLKIPLGVASELKELEKLAKEFNWDGPAAFTELRNSMVHPGKMEKQKKKLGGSRLPVTDAWRLGLWHLELALLALFEHNGVYASRLKLPHIPGTVTNVPWSTSR
jgi:hypothetical protein